MVFISGGGSYRQSELLDERFFSNCHRILYIPVGLKRNFSGYEGCWEWFCTVCAYHHFEINNIDMCISLHESPDLNNYDGIYIGGASNLLYLHSLLNVSGFGERIVAFNKRGGKVYGGSAGGELLGKSLPLYRETGLSLLPFSIYSHYTGNKEVINLHFEKDSCPLIILKEDSGMVFEKNIITAVGYSDVELYMSTFNIVSLHNKCTFVL